MNRNQWLTATVLPHLNKVNKAVEVGVWRGDYSAIILALLRPENFYGVDPYLLHDEYADCPDDQEFANQQNLDDLYKRVHNRFDNWRNATLIRAKGVDAAKQFLDGELDFVYIDGDHSYEFAKNDIAAWWPKIKPGGILSGHDYTVGNPEKGHVYGVIQAVDEFAHREDLTVHTTAEQYATWWVIK
jgi:hypothetical protein